MSQWIAGCQEKKERDAAGRDEAELADKYGIELRDFPGRAEWGVKR
jgi:hypothetical protein